MSADADARTAFEAWISAPPFEREIERMGEESAWPGSYRPLDVDLAWYAYSAGAAAERERCALICEGIAGGNKWSDAATAADVILARPTAPGPAP